MTSPQASSRSRSARVVRVLVVGTLFLAATILMLLWLAGYFHPKIGRQADVGAAAGRPAAHAVVPVRVAQMPRQESAVGTVEAVHKTQVASKLLAKVLDVGVQAGQRVALGEVLVRLDDQDLSARAQRAAAAVEAATALRDQARIEFDRVQRLSSDRAATALELEQATTSLRAAEAQLAEAEQTRREAETVLGYATIRSPLTGVVVDKQVEAGDTVSPGQTLLTLYDPDRMQLVARVRESLTRRLSVGQTIDVRVEALQKTCQGSVSEIVPEAESASRTFSVKVTGPCPEGIYSGMFGRLLIPLDDEQVILIPQAAVQRVGQLDLVDVVEDGRQQRRTVQLGRTFGEDVEVLSGLSAGEQVTLSDDRAPGA